MYQYSIIVFGNRSKEEVHLRYQTQSLSSYQEGLESWKIFTNINSCRKQTIQWHTSRSHNLIWHSGSREVHEYIINIFDSISDGSYLWNTCNPFFHGNKFVARTIIFLFRSIWVPVSTMNHLLFLLQLLLDSVIGLVVLGRSFLNKTAIESHIAINFNRHFSMPSFSAIVVSGYSTLFHNICWWKDTNLI